MKTDRNPQKARQSSARTAKEASEVKPRATSSEIVLLAVTGMTPAVLTETVWALAHAQLPVIPNRVVVVTTRRGKEFMERELFSPASGGKADLWQTLRNQILGSAAENSRLLNLETIREISAPNPRTGRSEALEDFRTSAENAAMADFLLDQVRGLVETPGVELITSIAGGRKTLGALLYACMSLLGRETDRLTHVLVNEPFDNPGLSPRFYFPKQPIQQLTTSDGKTVLAKNGRIDLGDIPFVPLRNLFERDLIRKPCSFTELVNRCRRKVNEVASRNVNLTLWRSRREIEVNGVRVQTSNLQHVLLLFLAEPGNAAACAQITKFDNALEPLRAFADKLYAQRKPDNFADWRAEARLPGTFDDQNLRRSLNELKNKLRDAGAEAAPLAPLLPARGRFSLDLAPTAIVIRD
ncbi:MAG: TIGR02584 family CRISPR-associated protein [Verrucomicrobia bacterium]|nr:TIGR02584 family CRISPR-associated protein [Verrucomicrobiota bacterium]